MRLGWNFGRVPFGLHQVLAFKRRAEQCICDPRFNDFAHDVACPIHGLKATLAASVRRIRDEERLAA